MKSNYITVQEFLPKWTEFMETHLGGDSNLVSVQEEFGLDIASGSFCIVGEGHGFGDLALKDLASCSDCARLSYGGRIDKVTYLQATYNLKNFLIFKQGLYYHFMQMHPEKLIRK